MELSREAILEKTHYGINIYAHVLRQYFPGETVLSLSGRDCKPILNPFNGNRPSLHISIKDNCAIHEDDELPEFKGNSIDFAELHYKLAGQDLLEKLNDEMHLLIGKAYSFYNRKEEKPFQPNEVYHKVSVPVFSFYNGPVKNIIPARNISLLQVYELVKGDSFASQTSTLRSIEDKKKAKEFKAAQFSYVTFSGTFSKRADKALIRHSGLLTIDLDHIDCISEWITRLLKDEYFETELLFTSPSGDGLKWIIPIDLTRATHLEYFKSISNYIFQTYGLKIDNSGSDCSRACFLPHDPNIFINPKYLT